MINRGTDYYEELLREDCIFVFHRSVDEFGKKMVLDCRGHNEQRNVG